MLSFALVMLVLTLVRVDDPASAEGPSGSQASLGASLPYHRYAAFVAADSASGCTQVQAQSASIIAADQVSVSAIAQDPLVADQLVADGKNVGIGMVVGLNEDWVTAWSKVYGSTQVQAVAAALTGCATPTPAPTTTTPTPSSTATGTLTPTATGTGTATPSQTATKTGTAVPSPSPSATSTGTVPPSATATSTGTATATSTSTSTPVPGVSPSPTQTKTSTPTPSPSPSATPTSTPTPPPVSCTHTPGTTFTASNGDSLTVTYLILCPPDVEHFDLETPDVVAGATILITMDRSEYPRNGNPTQMTQDTSCATAGKCWDFVFTAQPDAPCAQDPACTAAPVPDTTKKRFNVDILITTLTGGTRSFAIRWTNS